MSNIYTSADQLIGHTPLLELTHIEKASVYLCSSRMVYDISVTVAQIIISFT